MTKLRCGAILFLALSSLTAATARAQSGSESIPNHPVLSDRLRFELGGFYSRSSTSASLGPSSGGVGVVVDFEESLGLDERNATAIAGFLWRITERWRLEVEYFKLDRKATRNLAADVTWGDQTFTAGTTVTSEFDFSDIRISGGYSFYKRRDKEIGIGFGFHVADIKGSLRSASGATDSGDVTAPLPVLNLYGVMALTNEWAVRFRMDWLSLSYGDYRGDIRGTAIDVIYQPFRNVGFGLGARSLIVDLEVTSPDWNGKARTVFSGPTAFMTVSF